MGAEFCTDFGKLDEANDVWGSIYFDGLDSNVSSIPKVKNRDSAGHSLRSF